MDENRNEDWKMDPKLKNIDAGKLDMLQKLAEKGSGKSASDMLPFLMSAAASGKKNGLNFSQNEISAVLEVMKAGKSPQEAAKIDKIVSSKDKKYLKKLVSEDTHFSSMNVKTARVISAVTGIEKEAEDYICLYTKR